MSRVDQLGYKRRWFGRGVDGSVALPAMGAAMVAAELKRLENMMIKGYLTIGRVNLDVVLPVGAVADNARYEVTSREKQVDGAVLVTLKPAASSVRKWHNDAKGNVRWVGKGVRGKLPLMGKSICNVTLLDKGVVIVQVEADRIQPLQAPRKFKTVEARKAAAPVVTAAAPIATGGGGGSSALAPCLEHVRMKALVAEINRRVAEDSDMSMDLRDGQLVVLVEYS